MVRLVSSEKDDSSDDVAGSRILIVNGEIFTNSAAAFWSKLIGELQTYYSRGVLIEMSAPSGELLSENHLYPQLAFARMAESLWDKPFQEEIAKTIAEIDLFGPPAAVAVRVVLGEEELLEGDFPIECVDEEIFSCLLVWLLQWAQIAADTWNEEQRTGRFGVCIMGGGDFEVLFNLENRHVSEGLYRRTLTFSTISREEDHE